MAVEKKWLSVSKVFTGDGTNLGVIPLADTCDLYAKQIITLYSDTLTDGLVVEIKRVFRTEIHVGLTPADGGSITSRLDVSAFTAADNARIFAPEQNRKTVKLDDIIQAIYAREPAVAARALLVDKVGDPWSDLNPMPITGTLSVGGAGTVNIINKTVPLANTEVSQALPSNTKRFQIGLRGNQAVLLKFAFTLGESGTKFITVHPGSTKEVGDLNLIGKTLYMQTTKANQVVEILATSI